MGLRGVGYLQVNSPYKLQADCISMPSKKPCCTAVMACYMHLIASIPLPCITHDWAAGSMTPSHTHQRYRAMRRVTLKHAHAITGQSLWKKARPGPQKHGTMQRETSGEPPTPGL